VEVGEHYVRVRGIPADQVVRIAIEPKDEVTRDEYVRRIEAPVAQWLQRNSAQDRTLFIVLTKGVPLRIGGTQGRSGTLSSVDSEMALLYRKMTGRPSPAAGAWTTPTSSQRARCAGAALHPRAVRHLPRDAARRLHGRRREGAGRSRDLGAGRRRDRARPEGRGLRRGQQPGSRPAAKRLTEINLGSRVVLETTSEVVTTARGGARVLLVGSSDPAVRVRRFGFGFLPGPSRNVHQFRRAHVPRAARRLDDWLVGEPRFALCGSPQSLAGDLIREGVTGLSAYVADPFLDAAVRPDILFPAYLSG